MRIVECHLVSATSLTHLKLAPCPVPSLQQTGSGTRCMLPGIACNMQVNSKEPCSLGKSMLCSLPCHPAQA